MIVPVGTSFSTYLAGVPSELSQAKNAASSDCRPDSEVTDESWEQLLLTHHI